ncbi:MAG: hypothetical protein NkDv07_0269 [Candidatus Improbicoccus devescovinae]|nr:MAG: hypothetical protein NkDv07_0269 [Candidatus Improbicoccus devescovinae]
MASEIIIKIKKRIEKLLGFEENASKSKEAEANANKLKKMNISFLQNCATKATCNKLKYYISNYQVYKKNKKYYKILNQLLSMANTVTRNGMEVNGKGWPLAKIFGDMPGSGIPGNFKKILADEIFWWIEQLALNPRAISLSFYKSKHNRQPNTKIVNKYLKEFIKLYERAFLGKQDYTSKYLKPEEKILLETKNKNIFNVNIEFPGKDKIGMKCSTKMNKTINDLLKNITESSMIKGIFDSYPDVAEDKQRCWYFITFTTEYQNNPDQPPIEKEQPPLTLQEQRDGSYIFKYSHELKNCIVNIKELLNGSELDVKFSYTDIDKYIGVSVSYPLYDEDLSKLDDKSSQKTDSPADWSEEKEITLIPLLVNDFRLKTVTRVCKSQDDFDKAIKLFIETDNEIRREKEASENSSHVEIMFDNKKMSALTGNLHKKLKSILLKENPKKIVCKIIKTNEIKVRNSISKIYVNIFDHNKANFEKKLDQAVGETKKIDVRSGDADDSEINSFKEMEYKEFKTNYFEKHWDDDKFPYHWGAEIHVYRRDLDSEDKN